MPRQLYLFRDIGSVVNLPVSIHAVRHTNSYLATGDFGCGEQAIDELVLQHVATQRVLEMLPAWKRGAIQLRAEGYSITETAAMCGVTRGQLVGFLRGRGRDPFHEQRERAPVGAAQPGYDGRSAA